MIKFDISLRFGARDHRYNLPLAQHAVYEWLKTYFIDIETTCRRLSRSFAMPNPFALTNKICLNQITKELIQMDINSMVIRGIFSMNDKLMQLENKHTCNSIDDPGNK